MFKVKSGVSIRFFLMVGLALALQVLATTPVSAANPIVNSVSPSIATLNQKTIFTVHGSNLPNDLKFWMDACPTPAPVFTSGTTSKRFECTPRYTTGSKQVHVKDKNSNLLKNTYVTVVAAPTVTSVSPSTATLNQKTVFTVHGSNLTDDLKFWMHDCPTPVSVYNPGTTSKKFECTPTYTAGSKLVHVKDVYENMLKQTYITVVNPLPIITSVTPNTATLGERTTFTISGSNLTSGIKFYLDECKDPSEITGSSTTKSVQCTPFFKTGQHSGKVSDGSVQKSFDVNFTSPVTDIRFDNATLNSTMTITVSGQHLPADLLLELESCTGLIKKAGVTSTQQWTCTPINVVGNHAGRLYLNPGGTVEVFEVAVKQAPPASVSFTNITPQTATLDQSTQFTITGSGFTQTTAVFIERCSGATTQLISPNELKYTCTPIGEAGTNTGGIKPIADGGATDFEPNNKFSVTVVADLSESTTIVKNLCEETVIAKYGTGQVDYNDLIQGTTTGGCDVKFYLSITEPKVLKIQNNLFSKKLIVAYYPSNGQIIPLANRSQDSTTIPSTDHLLVMAPAGDVIIHLIGDNVEPQFELNIDVFAVPSFDLTKKLGNSFYQADVALPFEHSNSISYFQFDLKTDQFNRGLLLLKTMDSSAQAWLYDSSMHLVGSFEQYFQGGLFTSPPIIDEVLAGGKYFIVFQKIGSQDQGRFLAHFQPTNLAISDLHCDSNHESNICAEVYTGSHLAPGSSLIGNLNDTSDKDIFSFDVQNAGQVTVALKNSIMAEFALFDQQGNFLRGAISNQDKLFLDATKVATGMPYSMFGSEAISLYLNPGRYYVQVNPIPYVQSTLNAANITARPIQLGEFLGLVPKSMASTFGRGFVTVMSGLRSYLDIESGSYIVDMKIDTNVDQYESSIRDLYDFGIITDQDFGTNGYLNSDLPLSREYAALWAARTALALPPYEVDLKNAADVSALLPECDITTFVDVNMSVRACRTILFLHYLDAIDGYTSDNTFRPYQNINRAEFSALIEKTLIGDSASQVCDNTLFPDVKNTDWFCSTVTTLYKAGIIDGYADGYFGAGDIVTRGQATKIISNTLTYLITGKSLRVIDEPITPPSVILTPQSTNGLQPIDQSVLDMLPADVVNDYAQKTWYVPYLAGVWKAGIIGNESLVWHSFNDGRFDAGATVTRIEMARWVYAALGGQRAPCIYSQFPDVSAGSWDCAAVSVLSEKGIMQGPGAGSGKEGLFDPEGLLNRAEAAKIISVAFGIQAVNCSSGNPFPDVSSSQWYCPYVQALKNHTPKIIEGYVDGSFHPADTLKRDQIAKMLQLATQVSIPYKNAGIGIPDYDRQTTSTTPSTAIDYTRTLTKQSQVVQVAFTGSSTDSTSFFDQIWFDSALTLKQSQVASAANGNYVYQFELPNSNAASYPVIVYLADNHGRLVTDYFDIVVNADGSIEDGLTEPTPPTNDYNNPQMMTFEYEYQDGLDHLVMTMVGRGLSHRIVANVPGCPMLSSAGTDTRWVFVCAGQDAMDTAGTLTFNGPTGPMLMYNFTIKFPIASPAPDDFGDTSPEATLLTVGKTVHGTIGIPGDVDVFTFVAPEYGEYRFDYTSKSDASVRFQVFRQPIEEIIGGEPGLSMQNATKIRDAFIRAGETVYVRVTINHFFNTPTTGDYNLKLSKLNEDDYDDGYSIAYEMTLAETLSGVIEQANDTDYFKFVPAESGEHTISFGNSPGLLVSLYIANPYVRDFQPGFNVGAEHGAYTITLQQGIAYYLSVRAADSITLGSYTLRITDAATTELPIATYTATTPDENGQSILMVSTEMSPLVFVEVDHNGDGVYEQLVGAAPGWPAVLPRVAMSGSPQIRIYSHADIDPAFTSGYIPLVADELAHDVFAIDSDIVVEPPQGPAPVITSVSPTSVMSGVKTIFYVKGEHLPETLEMSLDQCLGITNVSVSESEHSFECTPSFATGAQAGTIKDSTGQVLLAFTVMVNKKPSSPSVTPVVLSVTPDTAIIDKMTTFVVTGTDLSTSMTFWLADCSEMTALGGTSTEQSFECTPSGTTGVKPGMIKSAAAGEVLSNFTVTVVDELTATINNAQRIDLYQEYTVEILTPGQQNYYVLPVTAEMAKNTLHEFYSDPLVSCVKVYDLTLTILTAEDVLDACEEFATHIIGKNQFIPQAGHEYLLITRMTDALAMGTYTFGSEEVPVIVIEDPVIDPLPMPEPDPEPTPEPDPEPIHEPEPAQLLATYTVTLQPGDSRFEVVAEDGLTMLAEVDLDNDGVADISFGASPGFFATTIPLTTNNPHIRVMNFPDTEPVFTSGFVPMLADGLEHQLFQEEIPMLTMQAPETLFVDEPILEEPSISEPISEEPLVEAPTEELPMEESSSAEPIHEEPVVELLQMQNPEESPDESPADEPLTKEAPLDEPTPEAPVPEEPVIETPTVEIIPTQEVTVIETSTTETPSE
jgi:hypothetical protein